MNPKNLSRRQLLKGTGIALSVPWMEALSTTYAQAAGAGAPKRYIAMYFPNGMTPQYWKAAGTGASFTMGPILEPITANKAHVTVLGNVGNYSPWGGHIEPSHGHNSASAWTGTRPTPKDGNPPGQNNAQSIDQAIGDQLVANNGGKLPTTLHSLQVGLSTFNSDPDGIAPANSRSISWKSATEPLYKLVSPQQVFDRLVGGGLPTSGGMPGMVDPLAERRRLLKKSALDYITESATDLQKKLSTSDKMRLDSFLSSVRTLELRAGDPTMPTAPLSCTPLKRPTDTSNVGLTASGYNRGTHASLMIDLVVMAIQCDITRVVSFMLDDARSDFVYNFLKQRSFSATGSTPGTASVGSYHGAQHEANPSNNFATIGYWNVERLNELTTKLIALTEGGSNVLDNSVITFLAGMKDGSNHDSQDLPIALVGSGGGVLKTGGNFIKFPTEMPLQNVHLTILSKVFGSTATIWGKPEGKYIGSNATIPEILA